MDRLYKLWRRTKKTADPHHLSQSSPEFFGGLNIFDALVSIRLRQKCLMTSTKAIHSSLAVMSYSYIRDNGLAKWIRIFGRADSPRRSTRALS